MSQPRYASKIMTDPFVPSESETDRIYREPFDTLRFDEDPADEDDRPTDPG